MLTLYLSMLERPEDAAAFVMMYEKYLPMLTRTAKQFFPGNSLFEDALQMTWEEIARDFTRISSIPGHELPAYLATIMRNNCRDILRKERKYAELYPDEEAASGDQTWVTASAQEEYRRLTELIRVMPDIYRDVLELRLVLELSNRAAAKRLGISGNLSAKRFERGRAMLCGELRKEEAHHG